MQLADSIMRERRFPKFKIDEDKSELEFNKSYIEELRGQVSRIFLSELVNLNTYTRYSEFRYSI